MSKEPICPACGDPLVVNHCTDPETGRDYEIGACWGCCENYDLNFDEVGWREEEQDAHP